MNIRALYCLALLTDSLQRREKLETSMSFLLDGYRDMHIALVIWQLICDPDHLLSKETESVTCLWSTLATVFLRHICISKFTTALTYFRSVANYLITDSQCRAGICWGGGGEQGDVLQSVSDNSALNLSLDRIRLCKYLALKNKR